MDISQEYETISNLTSKEIQLTNYKMIKQLHLDKKTTTEYLKKLNGYRYIDEISDIKYGRFIRWIPLSDPNYLPLHYCGIICDIKIVDNGVLITCKNFMHRHYTFKMDECFIFQKLTTQEQIIINALDHLAESDSESETDN
jgi:hypothetical protein